MKLLVLHLYVFCVISALPVPIEWSTLLNPLKSCFSKSKCIESAEEIGGKGVASVTDGLPTKFAIQKDSNSAVISVKTGAVGEDHLIQDEMIDKDFPKNLQAMKFLGSGGFGRTLLVRDRRNPSDLFVLKGFNAKNQPRNAQSTPAMIKNEWKIINHPAVKLGHGNIIVSGGKRFLPMKFVDGTLWYDTIPKVDRKDWTPDVIKEQAEIVDKVKAEMDKLHKAGIVHLDVGPRNVILQQNGSPVLIDFGLAKRSKEKADQLDDFSWLNFKLGLGWPPGVKRNL